MHTRKKIAVNARFLIKNKLEGIGLFSFESLRRITRMHPEIDFYLLFDRKFDEEFVFSENVKPVVLLPSARHPILWYWWFELSVASWLNKNAPDLFLSPDGFGCLHTRVRQVIVIHDLAFEHFPHHVPLAVRKYYKYFTPRYAKRADRIATVSQFSKADIAQRYHVAPEMIDVVYNGANEFYHPAVDQVKIAIRNQYAGGKNYFIYVGSIHPRKNIVNLLLAFEQFKIETGSDFRLLIVGRKAWDFKDMEETYAAMKFKEEVNFLGHIPSKDLGKIMASAYAMVYISFFEGFGIPIIEAMSCEIPVITSNVSSMPEAAGNAALLVNPNSVPEIASSLKSISEDAVLRQSLIENGKLQIKKFSWDLTAEKLWRCCEKVLELPAV